MEVLSKFGEHLIVGHIEAGLFQLLHQSSVCPYLLVTVTPEIHRDFPVRVRDRFHELFDLDPVVDVSRVVLLLFSVTLHGYLGVYSSPPVEICVQLYFPDILPLEADWARFSLSKLFKLVDALTVRRPDPNFFVKP